MRLLNVIKVWKVRKQERRVEFEKQEQLIAEVTHRLDKHGFPMRTRWPD
jgi:hypothetical protein